MSKSTSSTFSEISLIKKLQNVTNTQDSIQTLSLWVLHHKAYYKQIVDQWLKCYLKAKSQHRLALFYLANDIVQHAKRKSLNSFLNEFMNALRRATKATDDTKIAPNINRVFSIWEERSIYSSAFVEELRESLCPDHAKQRELAKVINSFNLKEMLTQLSQTTKIEQNSKSKLQSLLNCKVDFTNSELLNKLKDKSYGEQFNKEFDDATKCLDSAIGALEQEVNSRTELLRNLEKSCIYYEYELANTKMVMEAFNNCELRVKQVYALLKAYASNPTKSFNSESIASVINMIQQAQQNDSTHSTTVSSLDQRLTSLMSGQFGFGNGSQDNFKPQQYDPGYQPNFNQYESGNQIESVVTTRRMDQMPLAMENMEPADMDLGDSDDDGIKQQASKMQPLQIAEQLANNTINFDDEMKRIALMTGDFSGFFPMIPPPPPPPMPPPVLKELFESAVTSGTSIPSVASIIVQPPQQHHQVEDDYDSMRNQSHRSHHQHRSSSYGQTNYRNPHHHHPTDNRVPVRANSNYSSNYGGGSRWKNNSNSSRGSSSSSSWKRNSYSNHH